MSESTTLTNCVFSSGLSFLFEYLVKFAHIRPCTYLARVFMNSSSRRLSKGLDKVCTRVPATFEQGSDNGLWKVQDSVCGRLKQGSDISCALCSLNHITAYQTANYDWPFRTLPFGLFCQIWTQGTFRYIIAHTLVIFEI